MRTRFQNLDPDRQEGLIEAATTEFCTFGFDEGSLNRILKQARMSKSSFYYYFNDKQDVFLEVARRARASVLLAIRPLAPDRMVYGQFWSDIEDVLLRANDILSHDDWSVRILRLHFHLREGGESQGTNSSLYIDFCHWIASLVSKGRELGLIRLDLPETLLVQIAIGLAEAFDRWMTTPDEALSLDDRKSLIRREVDLFRRVMAA